MKKRRVGIIGVGHVGAHVAYALLIQGIADEIVLLDRSEEKVKSEVQDLNDAVAYANSRCFVRSGDYSDLKDVDVIVNTVGNVGLLVGSTDRNVEMNYTVSTIPSSILKIKESGFSGVLINVTNPCDVITKQIADILDLPKGHVFGTGTGLDTSRLLSVLNRYTGIEHGSIDAYMIGEHGNNQFCPWSCVSFKGASLEKMKLNLNHDEIVNEAIKGGWVTFAGKHCTEYGISTTAARMVKAVLNDEKIILAVSCELNGEYGESCIYAGVPCVIGKDGAEKVIELSLNNEELAKFHKCCDSIRENIKAAEKI